MKFDELDKKLRIYETAHDYCVIPGAASDSLLKLNAANFKNNA